MSAEELATRAGNGLSRSVIANLENGRKRDISVSQLLALATALGVSPASLVFDLQAPYAEVTLAEHGEEHRVVASQWHAYGWFGGDLTTAETDARVEPEGARLSGPWDGTAAIYGNLKRRDGLLLHEAWLEAKLKEARSGADIADSIRAPWFDHTQPLESIRERLRDTQAELHTTDRSLRQLGVDLSGDHTSLGAPF